MTRRQLNQALIATNDKLSKHYAFYQKLADAARERKAFKEMEDIATEAHHLAAEHWDEQDLLITRFWVARGKQRDLSEPPRSSDVFWRNSNWSHERVLTPEGVQEFKKRWREDISWQVSIYSGIGGFIVGVLGVVVAIVAIVAD